MRGTVVFPADDRDLLQLLEVRGNNGTVEMVETVYVLTGSTYYVPEQLFACDEPSTYEKAEKSSVRTREARIGRMINRFYEGQSGPKMIAWAHTHPSGSTRPSDSDLEFGQARRLTYDTYFEDYEFFHIIHGLGKRVSLDEMIHGVEGIGVEELRVPEQTGFNEVSWYGENRRHKLAFYDKEFDPRPVMVRSVDEVQQGQGLVGTGLQPGRGQAQTEPVREPDGGIWD